MSRPLLLLACCLGFTGCVHINQGSRPMGSIVGQTGPSELPQPGDWCRVTYPETHSGLFYRHQSQVTGKVEAIDDDGLHLSHVTGRLIVKVPIADKIPPARRMFRSSAVGHEKDQVVQLNGTERVEVISEDEVHGAPPMISSQQNVAQQLVAAVPGRR